MKRVSVFLMVLVAVIMNSCENQPKAIETDCVEVRIVAELCGTAVLQVVSGDLGVEIADSWEDGSGNTFENVFTTYISPCHPNYPEEESTFFIKLTNARTEYDCAVCEALFGNAPEPYYDVLIFDKCQVEEEPNL